MNAYFAEFFGTALLILLGNGVVANVCLNKTKGQSSGWIVITTAWAFAVYVAVVVTGPYSGAHLNPAVTLGVAMKGAFAWELVRATSRHKWWVAWLVRCWFTLCIKITLQRLKKRA